MIRAAFARVKPDKLERLESWLRELKARGDEVRETFRQEGVRHEQAFILQGEDGPLLVYLIESDDHERARQVARASQLPIDLEHGAVMAEVLGERLKLAPLYNICLPGPKDGPAAP